MYFSISYHNYTLDHSLYLHSKVYIPTQSVLTVPSLVFVTEAHIPCVVSVEEEEEWRKSVCQDPSAGILTAERHVVAATAAGSHTHTHSAGSSSACVCQESLWRHRVVFPEQQRAKPHKRRLLLLLLLCVPSLHAECHSGGLTE